ncbi:uncharacterized protein NDAI_0E02780 [Naumovozyma dairenensis CBS 421]|uniref:Uncharacterized protein n=1 Tax=Naumovozyma dairenensis (strain ATCC 10597 / BCRC 20456 / CBS 421 / NBRC 0211 / NRRL Y-12639) TaxID=1071378 RepID=G0WBH5_NAUDC|nr:hypothetical protein NDAI_0E02780 [Naumovozyma dairenensis CBS 421]CCD25095.1 hypothetical protein NDAI_0E02780 [Naumovozyma dairenensis CBS 421]
MDDLTRITSVRRQKTQEDPDEDYEENHSIREIPRTIPNIDVYMQSKLNASKQGRTVSTVQNPFFKTRSNAFSEPSDDVSKFDTYYSDVDNLHDTVNENGPNNIFKDYVKKNSGYAQITNIDKPIRLESKPKVDNQDKLWEELDALNDVRKTAQQNDLYGGFSDEFRDSIQKIRQAHSKLIQFLREKNAKLEEKQRREVAAAGVMGTVGSTSDSGSSNLRPSPTKAAAEDGLSAIGATVDPEEGKYTEQLVSTIRALHP